MVTSNVHGFDYDLMVLSNGDVTFNSNFRPLKKFFRLKILLSRVVCVLRLPRDDHSGEEGHTQPKLRGDLRIVSTGGLILPGGGSLRSRSFLKMIISFYHENWQN